MIKVKKLIKLFRINTLHKYTSPKEVYLLLKEHLPEYFGSLKVTPVEIEVRNYEIVFMALHVQQKNTLFDNYSFAIGVYIDDPKMWRETLIDNLRIIRLYCDDLDKLRDFVFNCHDLTNKNEKI